MNVLDVVKREDCWTNIEYYKQKRVEKSLIIIAFFEKEN